CRPAQRDAITVGQTGSDGPKSVRATETGSVDRRAVHDSGDGRADGYRHRPTETADGDGQRSTANGRRPTVDGQRSTANGRRPTVDGRRQRSTADGTGSGRRHRERHRLFRQLPDARSEYHVMYRKLIAQNLQLASIAYAASSKGVGTLYYFDALLVWTE